ncbi:MAG: DNA repair exonuclease [Desulfobacterales bacterium]|nr:DNA repair exonuclease [Desulfobacterales bacterium]
MFTFLHASDIHLDSPLLKLDHYEGAPVDALRRATRRALENLVELAIIKEVDFVLITGDLYDGDWKDYNTGLYFVSQMSKLREAGIPAYIITGNHDAASKTTKTLRLPDGIHLFPTDKPDTVCLDDMDIAIHGQGFLKPAVKKDLSTSYPQAVSGCFNIGMLHTCATGREGHESYAPCTIDGLRSKGYDYWALGHIHKHEVLREDPLIIFPGNIQGRSIRETGPKGCVIVDVDDRGYAAADFHSLDVIRWLLCKIDVTHTSDGYDVVDSACRQLEEFLENNEDLPLVARVEISGASPAHELLAADPERWTNEIRSSAVDFSGGRIWIEKVKLLTKLPDKNEFPGHLDGPVGELLQFFDEIQSDPDRLKSLGETFNDLWKKLPRELQATTRISSNGSGWMADMLDNVRPMLINRLMSKQDSL